ncbi:MAG: membrane protein insertase YidC [Sphaerochaetaceae bacterium]|nr:membrane protein insertase YidC [Spirochaetales bacterium]MDY5498692.1 membrane protein insertase YidC [Sphaerochaetaceae bacterium]
MEKNTILAVVLSVIVITVGMTVQATLFPSQPNTTQTTKEEVTQNETITTVAPSTVVSSSLAYNSGAVGSFKPVNDSNVSKDKFVYSTNVFTITFDPVGASVSSIKLNKHLDNGQPVELLFNEGDRNAFLMYAGRDTSTPIDATFNAKVDGNKVIFSQDFVIEGSKDPFTITKTYTFGPDEYLFSINVDIQNSVNAVLPLSFENEAYTLAFEPQIGPAFTEMKQDQYSYRRFYTKADGSKKKKQVNMHGNVWESDSTYSWVALVGKYFSTIVIPDIHTDHIQLTQYADENAAVSYKDKMYFSRSATRGASINDTYQVYIGPQLKSAMVIYDRPEDNSFGASGLNLQAALDSSSGLGWLENLLMLILNLFYKVIPNYGIGIILTTLLIKALLYPLTKKSMASTAKMSELQPKLNEIRERYPNDPQKQNMLMSELYRKEKINPMGGCLPLLIQFPILIAYFGLLNKHFELRGAMFIPGWIPDLSQPDTIFTFPFNIPFLGNQLHLLPILYTISMIFSMKITQNQNTGSDQKGMMAFMTYGMPLIFFFWLYNSPSGLMVYWSVMNVVSIIQQQFMNKSVKKNEAKNAKFTVTKNTKKK